MRLSLVALAATAVSVQAFKDTSPFILFSNSPLPSSFQEVSTSQLQSKTQVLSSAKKFLDGCQSQIYYLISQPSISFSELSSSAPHLKNSLSNPGVQSRFTVGEVVGFNASDADEIEAYIQSQCGAKKADYNGGDIKSALKQRTGTQGSSVIVRVNNAAIEGESREEMVGDADSALYPLLAELPKGYKYTLIYATTPSLAPAQPDHTEMVRYESTFDEALHMDLKRNLQARKDDGATPDQRPLFEKYQFFNPGLFMGLLVGLLLLSILGVGFAALGSLQVSYGAFDKEMGPAAQKKQQ
ncbi:BIG1-domain-containing protein [Acephala macrosclerotiorum]|nr:BIG1-domain-containing protein [Acephala macrosclerotiorum]